MQENTSAGKNSTSLIFWLVAAVALFWNGLGCVNLFQQLSPSGIATLPQEYQAFIESRPPWAFVGFAVSVISGLIAALLLIMRRKHAVPIFVLSAIGALVALVPTLNYGEVSLLIGTAMSTILAMFFAWYATKSLG